MTLYRLISRRLSSHVFMLSLILSDILVALCSMPISVAILFNLRLMPDYPNQKSNIYVQVDFISNKIVNQILTKHHRLNNILIKLDYNLNKCHETFQNYHRSISNNSIYGQFHVRRNQPSKIFLKK